MPVPENELEALRDYIPDLRRKLCEGLRIVDLLVREIRTVGETRVTHLIVDEVYSVCGHLTEQLDNLQAAIAEPYVPYVPRTPSEWGSPWERCGSEESQSDQGEVEGR